MFGPPGFAQEGTEILHSIEQLCKTCRGVRDAWND